MIETQVHPAYVRACTVQHLKLRGLAPNKSATSAVMLGFTCCLTSLRICGFSAGYERSARRARVPRRWR
jgi:hypothetical protein